VREAALLGLAELGGREIFAAGDAGAQRMNRCWCARRQRARSRQQATWGPPPCWFPAPGAGAGEGVLAALLTAIGQLGAKEALEVLAKFAGAGWKAASHALRTALRRSKGWRDWIAWKRKALLELYARDKEPTVKRAAEASLR